MSALPELAERCEAATGPDRELDMAICLALDTGRRVTGDGRWLGPDCFTGSIDAVMMLVFGTLYGVELASNAQGEWRCKLSTHLANGICERAATPALALCAAALRTRAASELQV